MSEFLGAVKAHLQDLDLDIQDEDVEEELVVVSDEERGINNLIVDCEDPILILEQAIMPIPSDPKDLYERLLEINRTLIHGAFALDKETGTILFRDTLRLDTLDRAEIEGTINALGLALAENAGELLSYSDY
ncbi:MAG TPA: molecular chaperone Tir [Candidatus Latescibacteria bacterium]|nr:molecular chaperone Tir [Gemmatimonadota bacterium]HCR16246.1 molecular chaperone Tir [Candidatus Latescibacterota bacterium]